LNVLGTVLAELWDFDTRISQMMNAQRQWVPAPQDYLQANGIPLRAYTQTPLLYNTDQSNTTSFLAPLQDGRWSKYYTDLANGVIPADEVPLLPPGPYNSTGATDTPHDSSTFTHHLIRDFMFLHAAANNHTAASFAAFAEPDDSNYVNTYQIFRRPALTPPDDDPQLGSFTRGTGHDQTTEYLLNTSSVQPDSGDPLEFETRDVGFTAMLYELQDKNSNPPAAAQVAPNWFGVAVPDGIKDLRNVVIYFHPNPGQSGANYSPNDYQTKTGSAGHTNWKELYAYVDRLGRQLAGAAKYLGTIPDGDPRNQIVIFPFMENYDDVGIFPDTWYFVVRDILDDIYNNGV
jgi:hypothetical protein